MPAVLPDQNKPLDFHGTEVFQRNGRLEAECPGCKVWIVVAPDYKGSRKILTQIPHIPRCDHYENLLATRYFLKS